VRRELLALDRVTLQGRGRPSLDALSLSVYAGEVLGLLPVNSRGLDECLALMRSNRQLHYGFVRFDGEEVNDYRRRCQSPNRVAVIDGQSRLIGEMSVAENLFVMRGGARGLLLRRALLRDQARRLAAEYGLGLEPDAVVADLRPQERWRLEILKAVLGGARLIVVRDILDRASVAELDELRGFLAGLRAKGLAFMVVIKDAQSLLRVSDRVALYKDGRVAMTLRDDDLRASVLERALSALSERGPEGPGRLGSRGGEPSLAVGRVLGLHGLALPGVGELRFWLLKGEIAAIRDESGLLAPELERLFLGGPYAAREHLYLGSAPVSWPDRRRAVRGRAYGRSALFPDLSYLDNLAFSADHRLAFFWSRPRVRRSLRAEYVDLIGPVIDEPNLWGLDEDQLLSLSYYRLLLQRPLAALCLEPFSGLDLDQRARVCRLLGLLRERGCSVLIVEGGSAESPAVADRVLRLDRNLERPGRAEE